MAPTTRPRRLPRCSLGGRFAKRRVACSTPLVGWRVPYPRDAERRGRARWRCRSGGAAACSGGTSVPRRVLRWARRERAAGTRFDCAIGNPPFIGYQTWGGGVQVGRHFRRARNSAWPFPGSRVLGVFLVVAPACCGPAVACHSWCRPPLAMPRYAAPLLEYLVSRFADVRIVAVRRKLFPAFSECALALCLCGTRLGEQRQRLPPRAFGRR